MYLLGISMVISVAVIHMSKNRQSRPVPWFVKDQLDGHLGAFLGLNRLAFEVKFFASIGLKFYFKKKIYQIHCNQNKININM